MIDPSKITKYNETQEQLEEKLLFWVFVAGHNANSTVIGLNKLLKLAYKKTRVYNKPLLALNRLSEEVIQEYCKASGLGCYKSKTKTIKQLTYSRLDLKRCSLHDLEKIHGIGPKTSRCFLIHSRKNQQLAGLDVHVLKYLRDNGMETPKSTPKGNKYLELEAKFIELANKSGKTIANFDLEIWNKYRSKND